MGCCPALGHGVQDAPMHAGWWLGVPETRQQACDRLVRVFHRAFLLWSVPGLRAVPATSLLLSKAALALPSHFGAVLPRSPRCPVPQRRKAVTRGAPLWAVALFHAAPSENVAPSPSLCRQARWRWPGILRTFHPVGRDACASFGPGRGSRQYESARRAYRAPWEVKDDARERG